jgi:regulator of sigma E protease
MNWLWFIPILLIMVVVHELGHFVTARIFGIKVHEFAIGFPPKIWSRKDKNGIEWSLNALPIGGFVRIEGENGDSDDPNAFSKKPPWQRAIVLAAGATMNLVLALVIYYGVSLASGKEMEKGQPAIFDVVPNSPAAAAGIQPGDIIISANGKQVKTVADFRIETTLERSKPVELVMQRNGQNYNTSVLPRKSPPDGEGAIGVTLGNVVTGNDIQLGNAAALNGELGLSGDAAFRDRDKIVAIDGQPLKTNADLLTYVRTTNKESVTITVERDGRQVTQTVPMHVRVDYVFKSSAAENQKLPVSSVIRRLDDTTVRTREQYENYIKANPNKEIKLYYSRTLTGTEQMITLPSNTTLEAGAVNRAPRVNNFAVALYRPIEQITFNPISAVGEAWDQTAYAVTLIPRTFKALFDGSISFSSMAGPVGMAQITDTVITQSAENGWGSALKSALLLMAMLSVNLGVVNLLPLPALDGGRLVFVFFEMITRGRRVPPDKESLVHAVGMFTLLALMVLIAWQDIVRLVTGAGFN